MYRNIREKIKKMVSRITAKGGYMHRQRGRNTQVREEEIKIGERMMLVSDRMRKEVLVLLENIDGRSGMSVQELRDVIKTGLKVVVEAVEETMTGISDTLTKERKERKDEEKRIGDRINRVEERDGCKEDRMRRMEERIDEKESKVVDIVRKVEDKMQEELCEIVDRTKNVEEKVLEIERRFEDRVRKIEEKKKVVESKFQEQMESMKVKMKEKVDTEEIERRLEDRVRKIEEKKKAMESKFQEQMERMEAKMKENEDKEERLKAEKEQSEKEESRKEMEEKVRHSNKQLKYTNIDLGGRVTSRKEIVERFIWVMREDVRPADRKRLEILLRRTRVVVLGKEADLRFIGKDSLKGVYTVPLLLECRSEVEKEELDVILRNGGFHSTYHWPEELLEFVKVARGVIREKGFEESRHYIRIRPMERKGRIILKGDVKEKQGGFFQAVALWDLPTVDRKMWTEGTLVPLNVTGKEGPNRH